MCDLCERQQCISNHVDLIEESLSRVLLQGVCLECLGFGQRPGSA